MESRFTNRFRSFCDSLDALNEAKKRDPSDSFVLSGTVQKFNITFDVAWKLIKDICVSYFKVIDFATGSPRETLRTAFSVRLIDDDLWMEMLDNRNQWAHDYDGSMAHDAYVRITEKYVPLFYRLKDKIEQIDMD